MPKFSLQSELPYSAEQMFDLVSDVAAYKDFLPWCQNIRVYNKKIGRFDADMIVGFRSFREQFTSRVLHKRPSSIKIEYLKGPMKYLHNDWQFIPTSDDGGCTINFMVDLEFKNIILEKALGQFSEKACKKLMQAFIDKAHEVYG